MTWTEAENLVAEVSEFTSAEIAPQVAEYDAQVRLPRHLLDRMRMLASFGEVPPKSQGGVGLDFTTYARIVDEISRTCTAILRSLIAETKFGLRKSS